MSREGFETLANSFDGAGLSGMSLPGLVVIVSGEDAGFGGGPLKLVHQVPEKRNGEGGLRGVAAVFVSHRAPH